VCFVFYAPLPFGTGEHLGFQESANADDPNPYGKPFRHSAGQKRQQNKEADRTIVHLKNEQKRRHGSDGKIKQILEKKGNCGTKNEYAKSPEKIVSDPQATAEQQRP
jgi:hypothetical protein